MRQWETLLLEPVEGHPNLQVLTLNRPESLNALNTQMGKDLIEAFRHLREAGDCRTLIITGKGERAFCAGGDLKERRTMDNEAWRRQHDIFEEACASIRNFPYPVIAAVNGHAMGGGAEIALSCDLRTASENATFGLPEVTIGIIPGCGGTQLLPRTVPVGIAKEMLFRGGRVTAQRAAEIGLVNYVYPLEELLAKTIELAADIAKNAPLSLQQLKKAVNNGLQMDLETALRYELEVYYKCANSEDRLEGIHAFNEKRKPVWKGK